MNKLYKLGTTYTEIVKGFKLEWVVVGYHGDYYVLQSLSRAGEHLEGMILRKHLPHEELKAKEPYQGLRASEVSPDQYDSGHRKAVQVEHIKRGLK